MSRHLPPVTALRAFEAAARRESFKAAAEELGVTPTAVSHQVKNLEQHLNQALFIRRTRHVVLTENGTLLFGAMKDAFDRIEEALEQCRPATRRTTVTLSVGPIIATKWLSPRLSRFWRRCPDIDLRLHHTPLTIDFRSGDVDMAIAWGEGHWPGLVAEPLMRIRVTPVLSPSLLGTGTRVDRPADLLAFPLLHQHDQSGWRAWWAAVGETPESETQGMVIEDAHVVHRAAIEGQGVALGIIPFIQDDLAAGRLVAPFDSTIEPTRAYYLVTPRGNARQAPLAQLRDWLLAEVARD